MATQTAKRPTERLTLGERVRLAGGLMPYWLVLPTILLILVIAVYPMIDSIWISLLDNPLLPSVNFVGLSNYLRVLQDPVFQGATVTTLIFTVISVALET